MHSSTNAWASLASSTLAMMAMASCTVSTTLYRLEIRSICSAMTQRAMAWQKFSTTFPPYTLTPIPLDQYVHCCLPLSMTLDRSGYWMCRPLGRLRPLPGMACTTPTASTCIPLPIAKARSESSALRHSSGMRGYAVLYASMMRLASASVTSTPAMVLRNTLSLACPTP